MILAKGEQRVEVAETDAQLIGYYTAEGWDEVDPEPQRESVEGERPHPSPAPGE